MAEPEVIRKGALDMQVCVPEHWTDEKIKVYAEFFNPCGTTGGWHVRKDEKLLNGDPYRNPCLTNKGMVHVTLDA